MEQWKKVAGLDEFHVLLYHMDDLVHVQLDVLGNILMGDIGSCCACGCYHLSEHCSVPQSKNGSGMVLGAQQ